MDFIIALAVAAVCLLIIGLLISKKKEMTTRETLMARTFARLLEGEREEVLTEMRKLYQKSDQDVGVGLALGMLMRRLGKHQLAIRTHRSLSAASDLDPEIKGEIFTELSADYLEIGLLDRARAAMETAYQLKGADERIARFGEKILVQLAEWDEACKLVTAHGKYSKKNMSERLGLIRYLQGKTAWSEGNHAEAYSAFKKAVSLHKACIPAHLGIAEFHLYSDKPNKALSYLKGKMDRFAGHEWLAMRQLKTIAMNTGKHNVFLEPVRERMEDEPEDWRSRAVLGEFLMETGDYEDAGEAFLTCLKSTPQTLLLHQKIWSLMLRSKEPWEMFRAYQSQLNQDLVFSDAYECRGCFFHTPKILWLCPSCSRAYSFVERKV